MSMEKAPKWVCLRQLSAGHRQRKCSDVSFSSRHDEHSREEMIPVRHASSSWKKS